MIEEDEIEVEVNLQIRACVLVEVHPRIIITNMWDICIYCYLIVILIVITCF